jgi:hypothetical protein
MSILEERILGYGYCLRSGGSQFESDNLYHRIPKAACYSERGAMVPSRFVSPETIDTFVNGRHSAYFPRQWLIGVF